MNKPMQLLFNPLLLVIFLPNLYLPKLLLYFYLTKNFYLMRLFLKPFFDFSDHFFVAAFAKFAKFIFALTLIEKNSLMRRQVILKNETVEIFLFFLQLQSYYFWLSQKILQYQYTSHLFSFKLLFSVHSFQLKFPSFHYSHYHKQIYRSLIAALS